MTPYELNVAVGVYSEMKKEEIKQIEAEIENQKYLAYLTARMTASFVWAKKIPEFKDYFKQPKKVDEEVATNDEMLEELKKMNAAFGGNTY